MTYLFRFRRCILLLLSLTLSAQAMAVASLGVCHRMQALAAAHRVAAPVAHHHADSVAHEHGSMHHADPSNTAPASDDTRVGCAACAVCHLASAMPGALTVAADIPVAGSTRFPLIDIARVRNVASGLERPPRA